MRRDVLFIKVLLQLVHHPLRHGVTTEDGLGESGQGFPVKVHRIFDKCLFSNDFITKPRKYKITKNRKKRKGCEKGSRVVYTGLYIY